jgi:hypothetical protein
VVGAAFVTGLDEGMKLNGQGQKRGRALEEYRSKGKDRTAKAEAGYPWTACGEGGVGRSSGRERLGSDERIGQNL